MSFLFGRSATTADKTRPSPMPTPTVETQGKADGVPGGPVFGPEKPQTREELGMYLDSVRSELPDHGKGTPIVPLDKTNRKYGMAKQAGIGESPEAEKVATQGMFDLVSQNKDTVTTPGFANHKETQRLDQEFHRGVTARKDSPYGPATTFATDWAPLWARSMYSAGTSYVPECSSSGQKPSGSGGDA